MPFGSGLPFKTGGEERLMALTANCPEVRRSIEDWYSQPDRLAASLLTWLRGDTQARVQQLVLIVADLPNCLDGREKGVRVLLSGTIPQFMRELQDRMEQLGILDEKSPSAE